MAAQFDSFIIGELSIDTNIDYDGSKVVAPGGAVLYAGYAAASTGHSVAVLPKADTSSVDLRELFAQRDNIAVYPLHSKTNTAIENIYQTADRERRTCRAQSVVEPYRVDEIPDVDAWTYHLAGLIRGDLGNELIPFAAGRAKAAVDVQALLRCAEDGKLVFHDWAEKMEYLPYIDFLKTDAAEAEILTGLTDRAAAARRLHAWGAKEVMVTHNSEALVYDGSQIYTCPIRSRNLSGRTGRGDTTFAGYINERRTAGIPEALEFATALVSLKMEKPGPFMGTRSDVEAYIAQFYRT